MKVPVFHVRALMLILTCLIMATRAAFSSQLTGPAIQNTPLFLSVVKLTNAPSGSSKVFFLTGTNQPAPRVPQPRRQRTNELAQVVPPPGVYKTEPFKILTVVPDPTLDKEALVEPPKISEIMPILRPEMRFIPLPGNKRP